MTKEEVMKRVLEANSEELAEIANAINKRDTPTVQDRRLLNYRQAADALGVSKASIRRLARDGRLIAVETRLGRKRILNQSITDLVAGKVAGVAQ